MQESIRTVSAICRNARQAALALAAVGGAQRTKALELLVQKLEQNRAHIISANELDLERARDLHLDESKLRRLKMDDKMIQYLEDRLAELRAQPDPVGRILQGFVRPNGLRVNKVSVPLGVIAVIYESRPNVTIDAAGVCLKSSNAVILRGGSDAIQTNQALQLTIQEALDAAGMPKQSVQLLDLAGHQPVEELLKQSEYIDVVIPRGGKGLIKTIAEQSRIPVIKHYEGICHLYIAPDADLNMALKIAVNSKTQRYEVCNALETLLVDKKIAESFMPWLVSAFEEQKVTLKGCPQTLALCPQLEAASEEDWYTEYLAPVLSVRIVRDQSAAIDHINQYGSGHTDVIVTNDIERARQFVTLVDSASVLVNASTRLSGGGDYGLGSVIGISTDKLHARGPVGPEDLCSYKWIVYGQGHLRE